MIRELTNLTPDDLWSSIENKQIKHTLIVNNLSLFGIRPEDVKHVMFLLSPTEEEVINVFKDALAVGVYTKDTGHVEMRTEDGKVEVSDFVVEMNDTAYTLTVHQRTVDLYDYVPLDSVKWDYVDIITEYYIKLKRAHDMNIDKQVATDWMRRQVNDTPSVYQFRASHDCGDALKHKSNMSLLTSVYINASLGYTGTGDVISVVTGSLFEAEILEDGGVMYTIAFAHLEKLVEELKQPSLY